VTCYTVSVELRVLEDHVNSDIVTVARSAMLTYSPDLLRTLNHDRPQRRTIRKALFTFRLWRSGRHRRRPPSTTPPHADRTRPSATSAPPVNITARRLADPSLSLGWLNIQSLTNKTDAVEELILERSINVLALTETWHSASDGVCLRLSTPPVYAVVDVARRSGRGGDVAVIFRRNFKCGLLPLPICDTFEAVCVRLTTAEGPILLVNVYRPGSTRLSDAFYDELASVLETLVVHTCPVVIGGDLSIHVHNADDSEARRLHELLTAFDVVQYVSAPTHCRGGTLDLVMTFLDQPVCDMRVDPAGPILSDHAVITCRLPVTVDRTTVVERLVRGWRRVDLRQALMDSPLCQAVSNDADVDEMFQTYETVLL